MVNPKILYDPTAGKLTISPFSSPQKKRSVRFTLRFFAEGFGFLQRTLPAPLAQA